MGETIVRWGKGPQTCELGVAHCANENLKSLIILYTLLFLCKPQISIPLFQAFLTWYFFKAFSE